MRYASIRSMDISNGEGCGVALFVQGCDRHCYNCFNPETWDFNDGKEWNNDIQNRFLQLVDRQFIQRISILGGEPLAPQNVCDVFYLIQEIKERYPDKRIWLYTGYMLDDIVNVKETSWGYFAYSIVYLCDVIVDGEYIDKQKDMHLLYRGSKNQRLIDIRKTIESGKVVLWETK